MQNELQIGIISIVICSLFGYSIGPIINSLGEKLNILDIPDSRKLHKSPIVRIGGLTIFLTFFLFSLLSNFLNLSSFTLYDSRNLITILVGAVAYFILGFHDDIFRSSPIFRLLVQTLIAIAITSSGINISSINLYENLNFNLHPLFVYLFTCLWIVGLTNAINWLDGFDGLAGGFCSIISIGLFIQMINIGRYDGAIFFSILAGSIIGFLFRNFKPAFYIMGDCGSYFLGFSLAVGTLFFSKEVTNNSVPIIYMIILFSLPILDMTFVIFNRIINNNNPFKPDANHLHHRLIRANLDYKKINFLVYLYAVFSVFLSYGFLIN